MTKYTTPHSLPLIEPEKDTIRSASGDNLWKQLNALAIATGTAISVEGERVAAGTEEKYGELPPRVEDVEAKNAEQDARFGELEAATPTVVDTEDFVAVAVDSEERRTWAEYRTSDGGPTDWALSHLEYRLGVMLADTSDDEEWPALVDSNGLYTDLVVRSSDGRIPDRILNDWKTRMGLSAGRTFHEVDGVMVDATARPDLSLWGSSTLAGAGSHFETFAQARGIPFHAAGVSGNWTQHVMARIGAAPALLTFPSNTVPASGAVEVAVSNLPVSEFPGFAVTVAGVGGTLAGTSTGWTFTRAAAGAAVTVAADAPAIPNVGPLHRGDTIVLNAGKNNLTRGGTPAQVFEHNKRIFDWLAPIAKRCLVVGDFVDTTTPADSTVRTKIYEANALRKAWAGPAYFDAHAFATGPAIWEYTGLKPTPTDVAEQALGNKPPSVSQDNGHFNAVGLGALTQAIIDHTQNLGWY